MIVIKDFAFINQQKNTFGTYNNINFLNEDVVDNKYLTTVYRKCNFNYPKFFKMDNLSKQGFLLSEFIVSHYPCLKDKKDTSVICFNSAASLEIDSEYTKSIINADDYYPKPALFVYTLPNIVTGEICIRNKFYGESSFYVADCFDENYIFNIVNDCFQGFSNNILVGWFETINFECKSCMFLVEKQEDNYLCEFSKKNIINYFDKFLLKK